MSRTTPFAIAALFAATTATAQSIDWSQRVFGAELSPGVNHPYRPMTSLATTRPLMGWSTAGTPGIVAAGAHQQTAGLVVKLSPADGSELWRASLDAGWSVTVRDVHVDAAGDVVTAGSYMQPIVRVDVQWNVQKTDGATGARRWSRHQSPPGATYGAVEAVTTDANGDVLALASRYLDSDPASFVVKYAGSTGTVAWTAQIAHPVGSRPALIAVDAGGNAFASPIGAVVAKVSPGGTVLWTTDLAQWSFLDCAVIRALEVDPASGDAIVAGSTSCVVPRKGFVARIASTGGTFAWTDVFVGDADGSEVTALAFAPAGTVVAAGARASGTDPQQWFASKLSLADGAIAWTAPGAEASRDAPADLAIDVSGDVLLTGVCDGSAYCVAQLDGATGTRRWSLQTGDAYVPARENYPNAILAADGGVFFGGADVSDDVTTWTVWRAEGPRPDPIFANGFE